MSFREPLALPIELLNEIVDAVAEERNRAVRQETLKNCLYVRVMRERARRHLFDVTFFLGNGGGANPDDKKWHWFNRWCTEYDQDRVQHSFQYCTTIHYVGSGHCDVTEQARNPEHLLAFEGVKNLWLVGVPIDPLEYPNHMPRFGEHLGDRIQTLVLVDCTMDVNGFVGYLRYFTCLKYLQLRNPLIKEAEWREQTLPKFRGALRLNLPSRRMSRFLDDISNVTHMEHDKIIVDWELEPRQVEKISTFLSKSRDSLTHLLINSRWGPFDVSYLEKLEVVAIRSNDVTSILTMVEVLPLDKVSLLLFVPPGSFKRCEGWVMLDEKLNSKLSQTKRTSDNRLRFYMTTFHEDFSFDRTDELLGELLPLFTKRDAVHVDECLPHEMRLG